MIFLKKYISYFGFLESFDDCITPQSEIMNDEIDQIISDTYLNYSSPLNIVFASLFYRLNIEKKCLQLSVSLNKITSIDYFFLISIRNLYHFFDLIFFIITGLFKKQYLNIRVVNQLQKKNIVVFEQKKRNFVLKDRLPDHGLINLSYSINKTKYSKYTLSLGLKNYIKVISLKIKNLQIKSNSLVKYVSLKKGFNLLYKDLEADKEYKFFSQEGFVFDHRLFISFFKSNNFKTYIFFNNLNYSLKIPQLSDHIILRSEKSKKWIYKTDLSKVIVVDFELGVNRFQTSNSSQIIKIAYLPETQFSKKSLLKEKFLFNFIIELTKKTKKDVELIIRDHPQVYKKNKKYLKSIYSHFNSKHFKLSFDDHSNDFSIFMNDINILFSAYYSTSIEDSILVGKPSFILENSNLISLKKNIIVNDLFRTINIDKKFNIDQFLFSISERILIKNHKLLIEDLFGNLKKISFEKAFSQE